MLPRKVYLLLVPLLLFLLLVVSLLKEETALVVVVMEEEPGAASYSEIVKTTTTTQPKATTAPSSSTHIINPRYEEFMTPNSTTCDFSRPVKSSRVFPQFHCQTVTSEMPIPDESSIVLPYSSLNNLEIKEKLEAYHNVTYLLGGDWGLLCNKLGILAGMFYQLKKDKILSETIPAFSIAFSSILWQLDLDKIFSVLPAALFDCVECKKSSTTTSGSTARCHFLVLNKNEIYDVSHLIITFPYKPEYHVRLFYFEKRPSNLGFMEELATVLLPKPFLIELTRNIYENKIKKEFEEEKGTTTFIAIHRRWIEGRCYSFLLAPSEYNCYGRWTTRPIYSIQRQMGKYFGEQDVNGSAYYEQTNHLQEMDEEHFSLFERKFVTMITCNYTLTALQMQIINETWPEQAHVFFGKPFVVLLGTDGQAPRGDAALLASKYPKKVIELGKLELPSCYSGKKLHDMLAEMLFMTWADLHMDLPTSSCSAIVAIWRKEFGKKSKGTSYPTECYDSFYDD